MRLPLLLLAGVVVSGSAFKVPGPRCSHVSGRVLEALGRSGGEAKFQQGDHIDLYRGATVYGADSEHETVRASKALIFVHSVWMDRLGMLGAWIFALQTSCQLWAHVTRSSLGSQLNLAFNAVYTLFYGSFMVAYSTQEPRHRPRASYQIGVGLYTLGYGIFTVYFAPVLKAWNSKLFHLGSWLFLTGSAVLIYATEFAARVLKEPKEAAPAHSVLWVLCMDKRRTLDEVERLTRQERDDEKKLLGGNPIPNKMRSMMLAGLEHSGLPAFLVGSAFFAFAAAASNAPLASRAAVTAGLALFLLGRVLFVRGSQTELCDLFFRTRWRFNVKTSKWKECVPHWAHGIGYY